MVDPADPNLLRDDFPYTRIPPIRFEPTGVAQARPDEIWITDTTFRDGQQARAPYTIDQIVHLYDLLAKLGGPVIRQTELFAYTPLDREAIDACRPRRVRRSAGRFAAGAGTAGRRTGEVPALRHDGVRAALAGSIAAARRAALGAILHAHSRGRTGEPRMAWA